GGSAAGIEVRIRQHDPTVSGVLEAHAVSLAGGAEALGKESLGFRRRSLERERLERAELREHLHHGREEFCRQTWFPVHRSVFVLILLTCDPVDERAALHGGCDLLDLLFL